MEDAEAKRCLVIPHLLPQYTLRKLNV